MKVKIKDRKEIAEGSLEIIFDNSSHEVTFTPGQFCRVTLIAPPYTDTRGDGRFLGFTSSPSQRETFSVLTRIGVSAFKKSIAQIPLGTQVEINGIDGRLKLPEDTSQSIVFTAGGIGIAPIMSILRYSHENNWPYDITLIYSNKNRASAPFLEELIDFTKETQKFRMIATMTKDAQWSGEKNKINAQFIKDHIPQPENKLYFITGTPRFVPSIFREIKDAGVPIPNLRMEIFTGY